METKRCSRCGEHLALEMFYREKRSRDGLCSSCKKCAAESQGKIYLGVRNKNRDAEIPDGYKLCTKCKQTKPVNEFYKKSRSSSGYQSHCKDCRQKAKRKGKPEPEILPEGMKRCWDCKQILPITAEYFSHEKRTPDGFQSRCKDCFAKYRAANREHINKRKQEHYQENRERISEAQKQKYHEDDEWREKVNIHNREYYSANREKLIQNFRKYYYENIEAVREYRKKNRERYLEHSRRYRRENPEYHEKRQRDWYWRSIKQNRKRARIVASRRRARKAELPSDFSVLDWQYALKYFDHSCAICGRKPDDIIILAMDHWIALSDDRADNPGTVPENIVPLCHGKDGCNNEKHARDPEEWLIWKFGEEEAIKILAKIETYFANVRKRHSDE